MYDRDLFLARGSNQGRLAVPICGINVHIAAHEGCIGILGFRGPNVEEFFHNCEIPNPRIRIGRGFGNIAKLVQG